MYVTYRCALCFLSSLLHLLVGAVGDPSLARGDIDERFAAARAKRDRSRDLRRSATHASHPVAPSIPYFRSRNERCVFVTLDFHKFSC